MPSTVVRIKPVGVFGPGMSKRAMVPPIKPMRMIRKSKGIVVIPCANLPD